jgi:hypothetical protein
MLAKVAAAVCHGKGVCFVCRRGRYLNNSLSNTVAESRNFYAAPAPCKTSDAALAAPSPTLLYTYRVSCQLFKNKLKSTGVDAIFSSDFV